MRRTISILCALMLCLGLVSCARGGEEVPDWQGQYDLGVRYLGEGNYQEAVIAFEAAIDIDPQRADAYIALADAYLGLGDTKSARAAIADGVAACGELDVFTEWLDAHPRFTPEQTALLQSLADSMEARDAESARAVMSGDELWELLLSLDDVMTGPQGETYGGLDFGDTVDGTGYFLYFGKAADRYMQIYYGTWSGALLDGPGFLCYLSVESARFIATEASWSEGLTDGAVVRNEYKETGHCVVTGTAAKGLWEGQVVATDENGTVESLFENGLPVALGTLTREGASVSVPCYGRYLETGQLTERGPDAYERSSDDQWIYAIPELGHFITTQGKVVSSWAYNNIRHSAAK